MLNRNAVSRFQLVKACMLVTGLLATGSIYADSQSAAPLQLAAVSDGFNVETTFAATCAACHNAGVANAPKPDDAAAWNTRMEKGIDAVMVNVINGLNSMPAKGLCFNCTDDDLKAVVEFMYAKSQE
ncbi:MAG: c-type cytochrome [Pseudohongiellaceae bacterium]